jgi:hypothetical protein
VVNLWPYISYQHLTSVCSLDHPKFGIPSTKSEDRPFFGSDPLWNYDLLRQQALAVTNIRDPSKRSAHMQSPKNGSSPNGTRHPSHAHEQTSQNTIAYRQYLRPQTSNLPLPGTPQSHLPELHTEPGPSKSRTEACPAMPLHSRKRLWNCLETIEPRLAAMEAENIPRSLHE